MDDVLQALVERYWDASILDSRRRLIVRMRAKWFVGRIAGDLRCVTSVPSPQVPRRRAHVVRLRGRAASSGVF